MASYQVGDIPNEDIVLEPDIDLTSFDSADVTLTLNGTEILSSGFIATVGQQTVVVEWPEDSVLDEAGAYELTVVLLGAVGRITLPPVRVVAEDLSFGWQSLATTRAGWPGAPADDGELFDLLDIAKGQVLEYAPARTDSDPIPGAFRRAQLMQARNIWNATKVDESNQLGGEGFQTTVFPMDWSVKNLIRPRRGVPVVG